MEKNEGAVATPAKKGLTVGEGCAIVGAAAAVAGVVIQVIDRVKQAKAAKEQEDRIDGIVERAFEKAAEKFAAKNRT